MYSRPEKLSDRQTIIYEIDMLKYCYRKLVEEKKPLRKLDGYVLLECFLLHYRNLIDFFGKEPSRDDLSISRPVDWAEDSKIDQARISSLTAAKKLREEYEGHGMPDTISRYLHHCTKQRTQAKAWPVQEMYSKLDPFIEGFLGLFPKWQPVAVDDAEFVVGQAGAHTATIRTFGATEENK